MRMLFALLAAAVLIGCTTPGDLMRKEPTIAAVTDKSPRSYALCVFPLWQEHRRSATMHETADGYRLLIVAEGAGQTDELLEVRRTSTGSDVRLYQRTPWVSIGRGQVASSARDCL